MDSLYRLGIDVGSTTVKIVITDDEHNIIYSNYTRHFSDIKMTVNNLLRSAAEKYPDINVTPSITGSAASFWPELSVSLCTGSYRHQSSG